MKNIFLITLTIFLTTIILALTIRGNVGNPIAYQSDMTSQVGNPFEASNSTSRYTLTQAIADNGTYILSETQAKFASPDVVKYKEKYISIFTPGVSFIAIPFYIIGKSLGLPQLITYFSTLVFALLNFYLVSKLARRLGSSNIFSYLSGFTFVVATNALAYAQTLTQHHFSTTFILLALLNALSERTLKNDVLLGFYVGMGALLDIPNIIMMFPIVLYVLVKHIDLKNEGDSYKLNLNLLCITILIGLIPLVFLFARYNVATTGSPTLLAQNIGRAQSFTEKTEEKVVPLTTTESKDASIHIPFDTRLGLTGLYTLLLSNERSWIFYSPVIILGLIGGFILFAKNVERTHLSLLLSVVLVNIFIYSTFADPWGGWGFGPRYLIPSAALLCSALAVFITRYRENIFLGISFVILFVYSSYVSTLGVLTTTLVPPMNEAINLASPIPYTYEYNQQLLSQGKVGSLLYNTSFHSVFSPTAYLFFLVSLSSILAIFLYFAGKFERVKFS